MFDEKTLVINILIDKPVKAFSELQGRTLAGAEVIGNNELILYLTKDNYVRMHHVQDCCESVYIESVVGDLQDLVGEPLCLAEVANRTAELGECSDSGTWTFYKFATRKGFVDVRFLGESNGYYSEGVDIEVVYPGWN